MHVAPSILSASLASLLLPVVAGCQQQPQGFSEAEKADIRDSWNPKSTQVVRPLSTMLIEGPAPLIYEVPQAGTIQVTDSTTGTPLAGAAVGKGTIIRIDSDEGIYAGSRRIRSGPLTPGRRYEIVLGVQQTNDWQSRIESPHPAPTPATPPANKINGSLF